MKICQWCDRVALTGEPSCALCVRRLDVIADLFFKRGEAMSNIETDRLTTTEVMQMLELASRRVPARSVWKHKRSGEFYTIIGHTFDSSSSRAEERTNRVVVQYKRVVRDVPGDRVPMWSRPIAEFIERFEVREIS